MPFDAEKLFMDYNIPYETKGKNIGEGWIGVNCPFCIDQSLHGGINLEEARYNCWICGPNSLENFVSEILEVSFYKAQEIIEEYTTQTRRKIITNLQIKKPTVLSMPEGTGPLQDRHYTYLIKRKFDPYKIEEEYQLIGTTHIGSYKFRIIIPIFINRNFISYQGRDVTGKQELRYKACKKSDEVIHYKEIVYNADNTENKVVIVEGPTDVWRLGRGSVATFGTGWTAQQVLFIAKKKYERIFILYDEGKFAQERAHKLAWNLGTFCKDIQVITLDDGVEDPGSMKQKDADYLMKDIMK